MKRRRFFATALAAASAGLSLSRGGEAAEVPNPQAGQGLIVFYRPRRAAGGAIRFNITSQGRTIGNLSNGSVIAQPVSPGQYGFEVQSPSIDGRDSVSVPVKAGQTVFIRGEIRAGWPVGRPKFTVVSETQGRAEVQKI